MSKAETWSERRCNIKCFSLSKWYFAVETRTTYAFWDSAYLTNARDRFCVTCASKPCIQVERRNDEQLCSEVAKKCLQLSRLCEKGGGTLLVPIATPNPAKLVMYNIHGRHRKNISESTQLEGFRATDHGRTLVPPNPGARTQCHVTGYFVHNWEFQKTCKTIYIYICYRHRFTWSAKDKTPKIADYIVSIVLLCPKR